MQGNANLKLAKLYCDEKYEVYINHFLNSDCHHLFNDPDYFKIHSVSSNDCYAQLVRCSDGVVFGTLMFHEVEAAVYASPGRGTFGGPSFISELDLLVCEKFLKSTTDYLRRQGGREIRVRLAPVGHDISLFAITSNCLLREGYLVERTELNYETQINDINFMDRVAHGTRKRIRKAKRDGFVCKHESFSALPEIHQLLAENRSRLGVSISMSLDQLSQLREVFPERVHLFAVYRDGTQQDMAAAAVCLAVSTKILYVFYWGDADGMRSYSPVTLLASSIYEFGAKRGFTLLDAGTSTIDGEPNHGLVIFKRNLGFSESLKIEMVWREA